MVGPGGLLSDHQLKMLWYVGKRFRGGIFPDLEVSSSSEDEARPVELLATSRWEGELRTSHWQSEEIGCE